MIVTVCYKIDTWAKAGSVLAMYAISFGIWEVWVKKEKTPNFRMKIWWNYQTIQYMVYMCIYIYVSIGSDLAHSLISQETGRKYLSRLSSWDYSISCHTATLSEKILTFSWVDEVIGCPLEHFTKWWLALSNSDHQPSPRQITSSGCCKVRSDICPSRRSHCIPTGHVSHVSPFHQQKSNSQTCNPCPLSSQNLSKKKTRFFLWILGGDGGFSQPIFVGILKLDMTPVV